MAASARKKSPAWKRGTWHTVTGDSGCVYELRIPSIPDLIKDEAVPERLRAIALRSAAHPRGLKGVVHDELAESKEKNESDAEVLDPESALAKALSDVEEIQKRLITHNVKCEGEFLTLEDLDDEDFPEPDAEMLAGMCCREVVRDAKGVRIGIAPLEEWDTFRHFHDCPPGCGACAALQDAFSTADLGIGVV